MIADAPNTKPGIGANGINHTSPSRDESGLSQELLRDLKGKLTFWQTEATRNLLSALRRGLTDAEFHQMCDDLARDIVTYGDI